MLGRKTIYPRWLTRRFALLLAFVCLWMSAGATLRHTDDLLRFRAFPVSHSALGHSLPAAPATACIAHQWMDAWQTLHAATPVVFAAPVFLAKLPVSLALALHLRPFDFTALRGPPAFSR